MSPNLTEAKEPSIEMPELIADREVIVKKPGKESFFIFWVDLKNNCQFRSDKNREFYKYF